MEYSTRFKKTISIILMDRIIMHVDLDSFYASLEEKRTPGIRDKPVVVCIYSGRAEDSGAVSTANYKARGLGIKAGMPIKQAKRLAEGTDRVFLPADKEHYSDVSDRIMDLLEDYSNTLEQVSIDEAYLDVTEKTGGNWVRAEETAEEIKEGIKGGEGLTCSVGVGPNKFVAKMASKHKKPDGLTVVRIEEVKAFLENIPVIELHGLGPKTADALYELGIETAGELAAFDLVRLEEEFGRNRARFLHNISHGIDDSQVEHREKQQIGRIGTLKEDTSEPEVVFEKIKELSGDLGNRVMGEGVRFRTVSLIFVDTTLKTHSKSETISETDDIEIVLRVAGKLLKEFLEENWGTRLRRVGLRVSNLSRGREQKTLTEF
ncbi:MAG: DNA polymerase IV [Candidatus Altiarchaeota archaeon]|nr:DNA polymerase IV [Candidatus Altiarchaeota archaeon]